MLSMTYFGMVGSFLGIMRKYLIDSGYTDELYTI